MDTKIGFPFSFVWGLEWGGVEKNCRQDGNRREASFLRFIWGKILCLNLEKNDRSHDLRKKMVIVSLSIFNGFLI
jgi:hypothetical protein